MNLDDALKLIKTIQELFAKQRGWSKEIEDEGIAWTIKNTIDKNQAKELVKGLNRCECCPSHQIDRPSSLEKNYLGWNCKYCTLSQGRPSKCHGSKKCSKLCDQIYEYSKPKECKCSCRCMSRHICRVYSV